MELETTNINDLPMNNQMSMDMGIPSQQQQMPSNEVVNTPTNYNAVMSQCMNEVNQHDQSPSMDLPARDIPQNRAAVTNDSQARPDFVPQKQNDLIGNVKKVRFEEPYQQQLTDEMILAGLASTLFLMCNMPYFKSSFVAILIKIIPSFVGGDGNFKMGGNIAYATIFGAVLYATITYVDYGSLRLAF